MLLIITASLTSAQPAVGFIGLGIMGEGMVNNLLRANIPVHIWSRNSALCAKFADGQALATVERSPASVLASCERTYLMLSTPEACEEVYTMPDGVLDGVRPGSQLVDCATLRPEDMTSLADRVHSKGGLFCEAPVSGSKGPAEAGQLIFMVAGDERVFENAAAELDAMGKKSVFCGAEVGAATRMKLVVNLIMGTQLAALAEGLALAEDIGLDVADMQAVLDEGAMASPMVKLKGPLMAQRKYTTAFPLKYALKDMRFALGLPQAQELELPVSVAATARYAAADDASEALSESDFSAVMEAARKGLHEW